VTRPSRSARRVRRGETSFLSQNPPFNAARASDFPPRMNHADHISRFKSSAAFGGRSWARFKKVRRSGRETLQLPLKHKISIRRVLFWKGSVGRVYEERHWTERSCKVDSVSRTISLFTARQLPACTGVMQNLLWVNTQYYFNQMPLSTRATKSNHKQNWNGFFFFILGFMINVLIFFADRCT